MSTIHLIDSEKGGVGKSLFTRVILHHCAQKGLDVAAYDADQSTPDVASIYKACKPIVITLEETYSHQADEILLSALEKPVIVNLPARAHDQVKAWIDTNGLLNQDGDEPENLAKQIRFVKWFLCNGGRDSIDLFLNSVNHYQGNLIHVFVRNSGLSTDWHHLDTDENLQKMLKLDHVFQIDFPQFSYSDRNKIDRLRVTFADAVNKDSVINNGNETANKFNIAERQRILTFLKKATQAIGETELVTLKPQQPLNSSTKSHKPEGIAGSKSGKS